MYSTPVVYHIYHIYHTKYYEKCKEVFDSASMNLRQWMSNDKKFMENIPEKDRTQSTTAKVLGMKWDAEEDVMSIVTPRVYHDIQTKRQLLQCISSVFDPLGLMNPVTVQTKVVMQEIWKSGIDWDEILPEDVQAECRKLQNSIAGISGTTIPRFVGMKGDMGNVQHELHVFTDASTHAYGAVAYLRTIQGDNITADLIFSKSRVAPTKPTSVPCLKLFGVVLGAKMIKFLRKESPFEFDHTYLWTDSKCALAWVTQHESRPLFIKRRIKTIHEVENVQYGFVPGRENPADMVSRGATASELQQKEVWWKGPNWLEENPLPDTVVLPETVSQSAEECSTHDDCPTEPQLAKGISLLMLLVSFLIMVF